MLFLVQEPVRRGDQGYSREEPVRRGDQGNSREEPVRRGECVRAGRRGVGVIDAARKEELKEALANGANLNSTDAVSSPKP